MNRVRYGLNRVCLAGINIMMVDKTIVLADQWIVESRYGYDGDEHQ